MISVIVCTYNRDKFIRKALESLIAQNLASSNYEIIVVNNNCLDATESIVNRFILEHPSYDITMVKETNQGLSYARNRGIEEAKYELICYIDDDGVAAKNYLSEIIQAFEAKEEMVGIGGKVIPIYETSEPEWYNPFLRMMVTAIDFGDSPFKCYGKKYPAGCSMTYRKKSLEQAGGFNNKLKWRADDKYIFHAVSKLSDEIYYLPQLIVHHHIDAERLTDKNFKRLSGLLGSEEKLRVLSENKWLYPIKVLEYILKYIAAIIIASYYTLKGQRIKGVYTIMFRKLALQKFLGL